MSQSVPSTSRLLVLGLLAEHGPMHGHQIRRVAEAKEMELWAGIRVGALYGAMHRMEEEGLIEAVRHEQQGRLPARTVYQITDEGHVELSTLQDKALREIHRSTDPFDVALSATNLSRQDLEPKLQHRRQLLKAELERLVAEREHVARLGFLSTTDHAVFRHLEHKLTADLAFLDELVGLLPRIHEEKEAARKRGGAKRGVTAWPSNAPVSETRTRTPTRGSKSQQPTRRRIRKP